MVFQSKYVFSENLEKFRWINILGLCMGIFWIFFIIWNRLIRERLPREITGKLFTLQFWLILWLCLLYTTLWIICIYKLYKRFNLQNKIQKKFIFFDSFITFLENHKTMVNFIQIFASYVLKSPLFLWRYIYTKLSDKKKVIIKKIIFIFCSKLYENLGYSKCNNWLKQTIVLLIFEYFPRILAFTIFFFEICIYRELNYFYTIAIILLVPLISKSLRRISFDLLYDEIDNLELDFQKFGIKTTVVGKDEEDFNVYRLNNLSETLSDEIFIEKSKEFFKIDEYFKFILRFYLINTKYSGFVSFILYTLLMISFCFWLLIICHS